jgi:DNA (cytosine-5)-methyltransferase 1
MERIKIASLFSGCGGTDLGIEGGFKFLDKYYKRHSTEIVYANDFEKSACDIFNENFNIQSVNKDIRDIDACEIPVHDILTGGFPCQSFSIVAQNPPRLGYKDEKGKLFFEMVRILKEKQPKVFVAENVKGILSANQRKAFPLILKSFEEAGYFVNWQILNAADFFVPQNRYRVFIVGIRKDIGKRFIFPAPVSQFFPIPLKNVIISENEIPSKYYFSQKAIEGMRRANKAMNKGRAQDISQPCNTVGSHLAKISLNSTDPVLLVNEKYRRFSPREVARIQSFPDNFILSGSEFNQYKALGNAIPPVLMWYLTKSIIKQVFENKEENVPYEQLKLPLSFAIENSAVLAPC